MIKNIYPNEPMNGDDYSAIAQDEYKFDVSARQIALAISRTEGISIDEAETLKQWLTNFIQDNINNNEIQI